MGKNSNFLSFNKLDYRNDLIEDFVYMQREF